MPRKKTSRTADTRVETKPLVYVLAAFVLSRIVYFVLGVRFDTEPLGTFWQYIDPRLLRTDLFESLYYLHSQPPLFNLFLGVILNLFPGYEAIAFQVFFLIFGLTLSISLYLLMTGLGVSSRLSVILTIVFIATPSSVLYENFLFYTYPVAAVLCLSALVLHRYLKRGGLVYLIAFFLLLGALVYTRSVFHLAWFAALVLLLVWFQKKQWKKIVLAAAVPFLLCFILYAKNAHEFGTFGSSSWFGMNFARLTTWKLSVDERYALVREGNISPLSLVKPFRKLETYQEHFNIPLAKSTGIPVLDLTQKSTRAPNLNNMTYIDISRQYWQDARYVLVHYPGTYISSLFESFFIYFIPPSSYSFLKENRREIGIIDRICNVVLYGQFDYEEPITDKRTFFNIGLFTALGYVLVSVYGYFLLRQAFRRKTVNLAYALTLLFIWLNLLYVTIVGNAFELGENNRFRFIADPLFLILLGLAIRRRFTKPG